MLQYARSPIAHSLEVGGLPASEALATRVYASWLRHAGQRHAELAARHRVESKSVDDAVVNAAMARARKVAANRIQSFERDLKSANGRLSPADMAKWRLRRAESDSNSWARMDAYYGRRLGSDWFYGLHPSLKQGKFTIRPSGAVSSSCNGVVGAVYNTYDDAAKALEHNHPNCQHYVDPAEV